MTGTVQAPFYVLCGSLGAGKTTLLMRLLEHWRDEGRRVGVLMNEAGQVSIDGPRAGTIAEQVLNLAGGCVCCDTKDDLAWGIAQLIRDYQSDLIILECSGMADPAEVIDAVTDVYVSRLIRLERVIALLHPVAISEGVMSEIVTRHAIRYADELILNKRDLYVPGHWEQFKAAAVKENPYARLWETSHARLDLPTLLGNGHRSRTDDHATRTSVSQLITPDKARARAGHHPMVLTVRLSGRLNRERFLKWAKSLPEGIERAKGFVRFTKADELHEFQFFPPRTSTIAPIILLDEPDHIVILIGREYDQARCQAELLACVEEGR